MFKKLVIMWLMFVFLAVTPVYSVSPAISVTVMGGSSDSCDTSNVVFWWRAEAFDFSATNGTLDYSAGDDTAWTNGAISINAAAAKVGSNGIDMDLWWEYLRFTSPTSNLDEEGKWGAWIRITDFMDNFQLMFLEGTSAQDRFQIRLDGTEELEFYWKDNNSVRTALTTTTADLTTGTWYWIEVAWKTSTNYREIWVDGVSKGTSSATISNWANVTATYYIGDAQVGAACDVHMDNIIITTDSEADLHSVCKDETEWPE